MSNKTNEEKINEILLWHFTQDIYKALREMTSKYLFDTPSNQTIIAEYIESVLQVGHIINLDKKIRIDV